MQFKGKQFEDLSIKKLAVQCFLLEVFNFQFTIKAENVLRGEKFVIFLKPSSVWVGAFLILIPFPSTGISYCVDFMGTMENILNEP